MPSRSPAPAAGDAALVAELQALREALHELQSEHEALKESARPQPVTVAPCVPTLQPPRELSDEVRDEREAFADSLPVPGRDAPVFNLVNDCLAIGATPWADPLVPAYLLDNNYRIVDWNLAFGLAFDRTMDGRRGQSILEWVYFLDNYDEVLERAVSAFGEGTVLPRIHIEDIAYTSERFGKVLATKRAYQVPGDQDETLGWLVTLEVRFVDAATTRRYKHELFELLRRDLTWSDYALSYDRVLKASPVYLELLDHVLGEKVPPRKGSGTIEPLKRGSRIIDLGSGTGNIPVALAQQNRGHVIFAVENNRLMLDLLRDKCRPYLRADDEGPGILAIKQDVNTLFGLQDNSFDYAILNNVAYALDDPLPCLRHVRRVLKADGEIRVSGPQKTTDLNRLFSRIAGDLKASGRMKDLQEDYDRVAAINRNVLSSRLYRWSVDDMQQMLRDAGFGQITYVTDTAYGGQSMIVCARKQRVNDGRPSSRSG